MKLCIRRWVLSGSGDNNDSSDDGALLGLAAAALVGTVLYRSMINNSSPTTATATATANHEKQLPIFMVEGPSKRKWKKEDAAYVIFSTKAGALNRVRHVAFCNSLRDKLDMTNGNNLSGRNRMKLFPTIWPTVNQFFNGKNSCNELIVNYDNSFARIVRHEEYFPTGRGPFLVAYSKDFSPNDKRLYWNFSDYETDEFQRQISRWDQITSQGSTEMEKTLLEYSSVETTRRVVMTLGKPKDKPHLIVATE